MSEDIYLAQHRWDAEERMRATCRIDRIDWSAEPEVDDDGIVRQPSFTIYTGECRTRYQGIAFEQNPESGGATVTVSKLVLHLPFGTAFKPGDVATILSDRDTPQLAGTVLRVASIDDQSQASAQRLLVDDQQTGQIG